MAAARRDDGYADMDRRPVGEGDPSPPVKVGVPVARDPDETDAAEDGGIGACSVGVSRHRGP